MVVADGYRESSVVRPDQLDEFALLALDLQRLAFARVDGLVPEGFWNEKRDGRMSETANYIPMEIDIILCMLRDNICLATIDARSRPPINLL